MHYHVDYAKQLERERPGDLNVLKKKVLDTVDITEEEFYNLITPLIQGINSKKRCAIVSEYYLGNKSIMWIKWNYGIQTYGRVEDAILAGEKDIIKMLLNVYPKKTSNRKEGYDMDETPILLDETVLVTE